MSIQAWGMTEMGRLRDHRVRDDGTLCPDSKGCARLYHGSFQSGMVPGDVCECCGQEWGGGPDDSAVNEPTVADTQVRAMALALVENGYATTRSDRDASDVLRAFLANSPQFSPVSQPEDGAHNRSTEDRSAQGGDHIDDDHRGDVTAHPSVEGD